jgi:hypothetical protein
MLDTPRLPLRRCVALAILVGSLALGAAAAQATPRLTRLHLGAVTLDQVLAADLDVVQVRAPEFVDILEWPGDEAKLARLGATREVLDENPGRTAARRSAAEIARRARPTPARVRSAVGPDGAFRLESLPPFGSGSLAGFWTLDEIKMKLDSLVANDPNDLVADQIDTLGTTIQGRPIWGLKLGKRVTGPDPRPVVFLNALTHAREPEGMQALFYFVDDLLASYGTDPLARSLLDHRVIYVVPVVNPDGYRFNQTIYDSAAVFGYQRKNLRDSNNNLVTDYNGDSGQDGVDLNRNFGDHWGYPNGGSSSSSQSLVYRGTAAFSEPETRAQRDIVDTLKPAIGISFHTYSDVFLHPYGWTITGTPDSLAFYEWDDEMTAGNGYNSGAAPRVLYPVNGEFNDWMYGDTVLKPRVFSWTPEIGNNDDGFWPPPSRIVPLAAENLRICRTAAAIAGDYVRIGLATLDVGHLDAGRTANLSVRARNLGLQATPSGVTGTLSALDAGLLVFSAQVSYPAIGSRQNADPVSGATFLVAAADTVTPGRRMRFLIEFAGPDGSYARDTIETVIGVPTVRFTDAAASVAAWNSVGGWGIVAGSPLHPANYFADSPSGSYAANANTTFTLKAPLDLSAGVHAWAELEANWEIEQDYDDATAEASLDGVTWTPVASHWTLAGTSVTGTAQPAGLPVYRGTRWLWKRDRLDLSPFAGPAGSQVRLRFHLRSDGGGEYDGFDFDSLAISVYDPAAQPGPAAVGDGRPVVALELAAPAPNPARQHARLGFALPAGARVRLTIVDATGRRVREVANGAYAAGRYAAGWDLADERGRPVAAGLYFARLEAGTASITRRLVVLP